MLKQTRIYFFAFLFLISCFAVGGLAQNKVQLESQRKQLQQEIKDIENEISNIRKRKSMSLNELNALNRKIKAREKLINTINSEINQLDGQIKITNKSIAQQKAEIDTLKKMYAKTLQVAYRNRANYGTLVFVLSAKDFNQAYNRLNYIRQYNAYRVKQHDEIVTKMQALETKVVVLNQTISEKTNLLKEEEGEKQALVSEKVGKNKLVSELQKNEKELQKKLRAKQAAAKKLDNAIRDIIKREIAAAEKAAREAAKAKGETKPEKKGIASLNDSPEAVKLSNSFSANQGKFPWPVSKGFISERYGSHPHPVLKNIVVTNNGLNFKTEKSAPARAIFDGKVTAVVAIPGMQNTVIVRHGEYLTVYSQLKTVSVEKGQDIKALQTLGTVFADEDDEYAELHFEIWKGTSKLDPSIWILAK